MKPKLTAKRPNGKEEFTSHHIACKALVMFKEHFEIMARESYRQDQVSCSQWGWQQGGSENISATNFEPKFWSHSEFCEEFKNAFYISCEYKIYKDS